MYFERGTCPYALEERHAGLAHQFTGAHFFFGVLLFVEWQTRPGFAFLVTRRYYAIGETGNLNAALAVFEGAKNLGDRLNRIRRRAAIDARVQIVIGAFNG